MSLFYCSCIFAHFTSTTVLMVIFLSLLSASLCGNSHIPTVITTKPSQCSHLNIPTIASTTTFCISKRIPQKKLFIFSFLGASHNAHFCLTAIAKPQPPQQWFPCQLTHQSPQSSAGHPQLQQSSSKLLQFLEPMIVSDYYYIIYTWSFGGSSKTSSWRY